MPILLHIYTRFCSDESLQQELDSTLLLKARVLLAHGPADERAEVIAGLDKCARIVRAEMARRAKRRVS